MSTSPLQLSYSALIDSALNYSGKLAILEWMQNTWQDDGMESWNKKMLVVKISNKRGENLRVHSCSAWHDGVHWWQWAEHECMQWLVTGATRHRVCRVTQSNEHRITWSIKGILNIWYQTNLNEAGKVTWTAEHRGEQIRCCQHPKQFIWKQDWNHKKDTQTVFPQITHCNCFLISNCLLG